ncbi:iron-enterobactin transporter periplasmic binding protein [Photorhabdus temperata subsp. temperata M1021]|nr:iron-enterobactin transporter periplasmic binding protein [Photorhabdus temperata subsp. temperata M1021]
MAYVVAPDLIVVSVSGADSAYAQVEQLKQIAPTIILDYGKQTWQDLATELGKATGLEDKVAARITGFDNYLAECRAKIAIPEGKVNIISYAGPGTINPISTSISHMLCCFHSLGLLSSRQIRLGIIMRIKPATLFGRNMKILRS